MALTTTAPSPGTWWRPGPCSPTSGSRCAPVSVLGQQLQRGPRWSGSGTPAPRRVLAPCSHAAHSLCSLPSRVIGLYRSCKHRGQRRDSPGGEPHPLDGLRVSGPSEQHPGSRGAKLTLQQNPHQRSRYVQICSEEKRGIRGTYPTRQKGKAGLQQASGPSN